jgi:alpha-tubulin suppressor-like RCC1 family protein
VEVIQVACSSMNTMTLTNTGEVYVMGGNTYGQHGRPREDRPSRSMKTGRKEIDSNAEEAS